MLWSCYRGIIKGHDQLNTTLSIPVSSINTVSQKLQVVQEPKTVPNNPYRRMNMQSLSEEGVIGSSSSTCNSPEVLVPQLQVHTIKNILQKIYRLQKANSTSARKMEYDSVLVDKEYAWKDNFQDKCKACVSVFLYHLVYVMHLTHSWGEKLVYSPFPLLLSWSIMCWHSCCAWAKHCYNLKSVLTDIDEKIHLCLI